METLAYYMFWLGVVSSAAAVAMGLAYALVPGLALRSAATDAGTVELPVVVSRPVSLKGGSRAMSWTALAFLTVYLGFRWKASGLPPISNMWEYTVAFGWVLVLLAGLLEWRFRAWGLSLILLAGALALFAVAEAAFSSDIGPTPPHLEAKHLLALHAGTMVVAYGAFAVSLIGAVGHLVRRLAGESDWLPAKRVLEEVSDRAAALGFAFFTLGLAFGAYWMNSLWGKYWDWDAKASSALAAWLIYAGYFHARRLRDWRGKTAPFLLIAGFAALMFSYFGVNLWS